MSKNAMNMRPDFIKQQIALLRLQYPELEADEESWLLALESESDLDGCLAILLEQLREAEIISAGCEDAIAQLQNRSERARYKQESLRAAMLSLMQEAGIGKKITPTATLSVVAGRDRVVVNDEASVPDIFCRIKREPDKAKIKAHLLEGASLNWASLVKGEPSISIRTK